VVSDAPNENKRAFRQFCVEVCTSARYQNHRVTIWAQTRPSIAQVDRRLLFGPRPGELEVLLELWLQQPAELLRRAADGQQWARVSRQFMGNPQCCDVLAAGWNLHAHTVFDTLTESYYEVSVCLPMVSGLQPAI
jgi:hypothetical protein